MRPANNRKHHNFIHQNIQMMTPGLLKLYAVSRLASSLSQSRFREVIRLKKMRNCLAIGYHWKFAHKNI
jgi:hypothetical protein